MRSERLKEYIRRRTAFRQKNSFYAEIITLNKKRVNFELPPENGH